MFLRNQCLLWQQYQHPRRSVQNDWSVLRADHVEAEQNWINDPRTQCLELSTSWILFFFPPASNWSPNTATSYGFANILVFTWSQCCSIRHGQCSRHFIRNFTRCKVTDQTTQLLNSEKGHRYHKEYTVKFCTLVAKGLFQSAQPYFPSGRNIPFITLATQWISFTGTK